MEVDRAGPGPGSSRAKGRLPSQLRTIVSERCVLDRADGSAKWTQEGSCVLAAVYGPRQAKVQREDGERAVVEVVYKPRAGLQGHTERSRELDIRGVLEGIIPLGMHPRTSIMVVLQVIQDDGSVLSCALNAAVAALVDAGVPLNSMCASASCVLTQEGQLLLDPDSCEEKAATAQFCFTFPHHFDLTKSAEGEAVVSQAALGCRSHGNFKTGHLLEALQLCALGCQRVAAFARLSLSKSLPA
ncbi:Exosome complex exonuclease RRP46 [Tetrabaena socialis]|uniref:Exosome complex exonuclease RRP46 n=1 Tax=Tetrabaena socialis TaxID=47790 RepID=A0A2J7ZVA0_9CHLO|nr:Exosome complex exonuclease RRP46 [Tetrabaena socialis]|eukprot:PNH04194.1 Exosome complex exonuclease RRP46 [Tetrabaena socialis]